jgi:type VI secretion system secreted protein Hcp
MSNRPFALFLLVVLAASVVGARSVMAVDVFVKVAGIEGESTNAAHQGEIEALGIGQGVTNTVATIGGGGGGGGRPVFADVSIVKRIDRATPRLQLAAAAGQHVPTVEISFDEPGRPNFFLITLTNVLVSGVRATAGADGVTEFVTLKYAKIAWRYRVFDPSGGPGGDVDGCWDVTENESC